MHTNTHKYFKIQISPKYTISKCVLISLYLIYLPLKALTALFSYPIALNTTNSIENNITVPGIIKFSFFPRNGVSNMPA